MKPSFKVINSPSSNSHKIATTISNKIFALLSILLFLSFSISISVIIPENAYAAKKNSSVIKSKNKHINSLSKSNKSKSCSIDDKKVSKRIKNGTNSGKNLVKNNNGSSKSNKRVSKNNKNKSISISKSNNIDNENISISNQKDSNVRIKQVSGIIKNSLHKTAVKMGLNKKLINLLSSIFKNTSALSNIQKGDLVQVAYQEKYVNGKRVKTGVITAAIITSKSKTYYAYRFTYNGKHGYYDENGNSLESSFLKAPLLYREISSGFSTRRFHPIKHIYQPHPGIDYAAPIGTPVKSVGDGIVVLKGSADSAGNYLKIKHPGTGISEYMHLSKFHKSIKVNKRVSKGDVIGYVGTTGYATGPHLDLRFIINDRYVDYRKLKLPYGDPLPKKFRNLFFQHVAMINKQWNRTATRELSINNARPLNLL